MLSLASVVLDVIRCRAIKISLVGASAKVFPARQPGTYSLHKVQQLTLLHL